MYAEQKTSKGVPFYATNGFDWSGHVLEPLALSDANAWAARNPKKGAFASDEDWARLFTMAQEFKVRPLLGVLELGLAKRRSHTSPLRPRTYAAHRPLWARPLW